ncbi:cyclophilin-like fold protein [Streptomyces sp. ALI-76-A]|uniref:cyclophilin-like fold protein n=1 Tax=Streptomyces sp. ALI-76-A TaxID=3025736 RepID=UPI00256ED9EC|nr:cyclophilin-like fold protein [Streptomyces sp. ALI-76-A]MDL5206442.1 cyclophilin-like fold protein [Streptomyces sp. ALI-76-A]
MNSAALRALASAATAAAVLLTVASCTDTSPASPSATSSARQQTPTAEAPSDRNTAPSDRNTAMDIRVTLDGRPVDATLNDSPAARDFAELLPLSLDLEDFHQTERIADLPRRLTTSGAPEPRAPKAGDLTYYAPWGNLALFYRDGDSANPDLLILGHIDADADRLAGADRITIEAAP